MADGVTLQQLYSMTPKEVQLRLYGIMKKRIDRKRGLRDVIYALHVHNVEQKHRLEIFDLLPIEGDPTPKQRQKAREQEQKKLARQMIRQARKMGYMS